MGAYSTLLLLDIPRWRHLKADELIRRKHTFTPTVHPHPHPYPQLRLRARARLFTRDIMKFFSFSGIVVLAAVVGAARSATVPRDGKLSSGLQYGSYL